MNAGDDAALDGLALAALVASREVTPGELLDRALARCAAVNPRVNAVVARFEALARAAIAKGLPPGPFQGVPLLLKDDVAMAGTGRTFGSALFQGHVDAGDEEITARLRRAGFVIFGRTNMPELAQSISTEPRLYGPTRNPWNLAHSAGGSSGGAAAAVAAGIVPIGQGGDGGGSLRIPAAHNGLFAIKATRGRLPAGPDQPERLGGLATTGFVSRSVRDSAAILDATAGAERGNARLLPGFARPLLEEVGRDPGRLRIALVTTTPIEGPVLHPACEAAVREAAALLEGLGHVVEEVPLRIDIPRWQDAAVIIVAANLRRLLKARATTLGRPLTPEDLEPGTWVRIMQGEISAIDYLEAQHVMLRAGQVVAAVLERHDLLLTPASAIPPARLGVLAMSSTDVASRLATGAATIAFSRLFNASGHPAAVLPWTMDADGLPIGVQLVAPFADEASLIRVAAMIEAVRPWGHRRPPEAALLQETFA